ncbi:hypothetical protein VR010_14080 [Actinomycetaceae bacterium L2_0104]
MSAGLTKGGVTIKVLTGRSAADLLTYRDKVDEGQESHVFDATRHCSHDVGAQIAEWQDVRIAHGTDGKMKTTRARYETVDPETGLHANGKRGTHVRYWDEKSNRWRKRVAVPNETPTHLRFEPRMPLEKESEATHTIYAFGRDMVNPDNPEDIDRAFQVVKAERDDLYPGLQESMWLEKNGKSGLVHVHVASNATIYEGFTHGGRDYVAGKKMAGGIVNVDAVRASFENYLDAHPEYGFEQSLARVGTKEYNAAQRRSGQKDYWDQTRGKESNHDRMRRIAGESLEDPAVTDRDSFIAEMKTRGVTVTETGLRRGVAGRNHDYTYRLVGAKKGDHGARGTTLGDMYSYDAIGAQLDLKAVGKELEVDVPQRVGQAKALPFEKQPLSRAEQQELAELTESVERLADTEKQAQLQVSRTTVEELADSTARDMDRIIADSRARGLLRGERARAEEVASPVSRRGTDDAITAFEQWLVDMRDTSSEEGVTIAANGTPHDTASDEMTSSSAPARAIEPESQIDLSSRWHEYPTEMRQVSHDIEHGVRQTYPDWDERQVEDAVQQGLAYNAEEGRLDQLLTRHREINERRATEERQTQNSAFAASPVETVPGSLAAPSVSTPARQPWQSRLRDVDTTGRSEKMQARIEGVAVLDERWHDSMPQTDEEHQAFEKEVKAAGGVAGSFLETYGDRVSPDVRQELTRRAESYEARAMDYEVNQKEMKAAEEYGARYKDPKVALRSPRYQEHAKKANTAAERYQETSEQIARGDYSRSDRDREQKARVEARKRDQRAQTKANQERREKAQSQQDEGMSL